MKIKASCPVRPHNYIVLTANVVIMCQVNFMSHKWVRVLTSGADNKQTKHTNTFNTVIRN